MSSETHGGPSAPADPSVDVLVRVDDLRKTYRVYSRPHHRLLQAMADRRGTGKQYCFEVPAVNGVSFDLRRGEAIAIIGRNGSGKSTLLSMISGSLEPSSGSVQKVGRVSALLELGTGFNPDYSGRQNFRINAAILGLTEKEIREIEPKVEAFAEIGPFIDEPVRTYSSGMYVRLAFATAVHVVPDVLIVDEALAVGDIFFQQKCFAYLADELAGTAKIIVTHDLSSAVRLATRCLVLDRGDVVFDGPPLEAVEVYTALHLRDRRATIGSGAMAARTDDDTDESDTDDGTGDAAADAVVEVEAPEAMVELDEEKSSSPDLLSVKAVRVARRTASGEWSPLAADAYLMKPGERYRLTIDCTLGTTVDEPVWGYLVRDRVGNALFGQNSVGSGIRTRRVTPGRYLVDFDMAWPEVEPGEYVVTVGLGDGTHPFHHQIVAWAQSIVKLTSMPERAVHGMFNNDLLELRVQAAVRTGSTGTG